jgi:beta-ribofuranosylaminobenzene 5'-phosphate synthase
MIDSVTVRAPARLHLGFLDMNGELGRRFGSLGLAIDAFETRVTMQRAARTSVSGIDADRARRILAKLVATVAGDVSVAVRIDQAIPAHAGLGSGTQLSLALAAALQHLTGGSRALEEYAALTQRGARSGSGIGLFRTGGFVVDAGHGARGGIPPIVARAAFPEKWRIFFVSDPAQRGVSGADEIAAFAALPKFSAENAGEICRRVLMQVLPGLAEAEIGSFGAGISAIQAIVGDYFAPAQGGSRFKSGAVEALLHDLAAAGATGIGQSSWGPAGFAFVSDAAIAKRMLADASAKAAEMRLDIRICKGLNRGAMIAANRPASA